MWLEVSQRASLGFELGLGLGLWGCYQSLTLLFQQSSRALR